ncbi:MarR family winged helix-turn-helix transcriptional regulator [Streptomyces sp. R33]|uniref:MarR family winged helix-turn-helix transcriptional regulator n=1 Tax=Streptomyces sp. R33 TaxID=3238629 RepID=A0AB39XUV1_9ACTN
MKPIGYWLNRTDEALTGAMNAALADFGLTRLAWQVLNVVDDTHEAADTDVLSVLSANADVPALTSAIDTLLTDGWLRRPAPGRLDLTDGSRRRLTDAARRVDAFRELSTAGISPDEYRTTVSVLERMTRNVEAEQAGRPNRAS